MLQLAWPHLLGRTSAHKSKSHIQILGSRVHIRDPEEHMRISRPLGPVQKGFAEQLPDTEAPIPWVDPHRGHGRSAVHLAVSTAHGACNHPVDISDEPHAIDDESRKDLESQLGKLQRREGVTVYMDA